MRRDHIDEVISAFEARIIKNRNYAEIYDTIFNLNTYKSIDDIFVSKVKEKHILDMYKKFL